MTDRPPTAEEIMSHESECFACKRLRPKFASAYLKWYCEECATNPANEEFFKGAWGVNFETLKKWMDGAVTASTSLVSKETLEKIVRDLK